MKFKTQLGTHIPIVDWSNRESCRLSTDQMSPAHIDSDDKAGLIIRRYTAWLSLSVGGWRLPVLLFFSVGGWRDEICNHAKLGTWGAAKVQNNIACAVIGTGVRMEYWFLQDLGSRIWCPGSTRMLAPKGYRI